MVVYSMLLLLILFAFLCSCSISFGGGYNDNYLAKQYTDSYRGLAAVLIVIHHLSQAIGVSGLLIIIGYIGFILVGVFFFLSGYGLKYGLDHKEKYLKGFIRKKILNILIPLEVMNIICLITNFLLKQKADLAQTVLSFIGWDYLTGLWFITSILFLYMCFYISFSISKKYGAWILSGLIFIYILICSCFGLKSYWTASISTFPLGTAWCGIKDKFDRWIRRKYSLKTISCWALFLFLFLGRLWLSLKGVENIWIQTTLRNLISVFFVIAVLTVFQKIKFKKKYWKWFGDRSLEIYMVHFTLIKYFPFGNIEKNLYVLLVVFVSIILSEILSLRKKI